MYNRINALTKEQTMLDYTKAAFGKIIDDFKKFIFIFSIVAQSISVIYLIYALCIQQGILAANIILLILSTAYLIFLSIQGLKSNNQQQKKLAKRIYKWGKLVTQLYTLVVALYALNVTVDNALSLSVLLTALQLISWVLQVLFEVISLILDKLAELVITAIKADVEQIKKPVTTVGNFFKKVVGKEVAEPEPPTKTRTFLDSLVAENKEKKAAEKRKSKQPQEENEEQIDHPSPKPQEEIAATQEIAPNPSNNQRKFSFFKRK